MPQPIRHPSSPPPTRAPRSGPPAPPIVFCVTCHELGPVEPVVIEGTLLYRCRACGRMDDIIPPDAPRTLEHFGEAWPAALEAAQEKAAAAALTDERARLALESRMRAATREETRSGLRMVAGVAVGLALLLGIFGWLLLREEFAEPDIGPGAPAVAIAPTTPPFATAPVPLRPAVPKMTILADGLALASPRPSADPVMRLTTGETYQIGEERDGYIRIADAPGGVEAWVASGNVRR